MPRFHQSFDHRFDASIFKCSDALIIIIIILSILSVGFQTSSMVTTSDKEI